MARKSAANGSKASDWGVDFVDVPLSSEVKRDLFENPYSPGDLISALVEMVESGIKLSVVWNEKSSAYICTVTSPVDPTTGRKVAMSSFAPSVDVAMSAAVYKWRLLTDGGGWQLDEITADWTAIR